jgi:hypothetical protein
MLPRQNTRRTTILHAALLACAVAAGGCAGDGAVQPDDGQPETVDAVEDAADTDGESAAEPAAEPRACEEGQQHFETTEAALAAVMEVCKTHDEGKIAAVFGPSWTHLLVTQDRARDRVARAEFVTAAETRAEWLELADGSMELVVGVESWPMPIPLRRSGAEELLNRRIGEHELETIETMHTLVRAQADYASVDRDGDQVLEYAQRLGSSAGKRDGLYWPEEEGGEISPLGPLLARAGEAYLQEHEKGDPWMGYYFRVLKEQGPNAPSGAHGYVINGHMIAGFAILAYPSDYGNTGVMTFIVSHQGVVYEKDLGADTTAAAKAIDTYDPDDSWKKAESAD